MLTLLYGRFRELKVEPATTERLERLVRSVIHTFEENFFTELAKKIPAATKIELDALLGTFPEPEKASASASLNAAPLVSSLETATLSTALPLDSSIKEATDIIEEVKSLKAKSRRRNKVTNASLGELLKVK